MLREADSIGAEEFITAPTYAPARAQHGSIAFAAPARGGSRYGESRRLNSPAVVLTVLIHVALLAALFMVRNHFVHKHEAKLTVLNLMPESPPPQSQPEQPKQQPPKVVAPRPLVQTPVQQTVPIQTTPDPAPQPIALPAAPAAIPGPPSPPAPASTGILQKGNIDGNILSAKAPNYPLDSRRKKEQGTVVLSVTIGIEGKVVAISVRKTSGFSRLDDAALDAVRKWRWKPFLENGEPVVIQGSLPIPFVLQG